MRFLANATHCRADGIRLPRISNERGMDLHHDVSLLRRIALRCMEVLRSTGFSLCGFPLAQKPKPHRLCYWTAPDPRCNCLR
jgi:hypothetical protein